MTDLQESLVYWAKLIANDNRYHYRDNGETNLGPWGYDCATYNSLTFYKAMGWTNWPDRGYFWPHRTETGFDAFLLNNGWQKMDYNRGLLTEGAIIITRDNRNWETGGLGHSLMYVGNNQLCDANNYFGYGDNSIAIRTFPTYAESQFALIYLPPDVPVPPLPRQRQYDRRRQRQRRGF